MRTLVGLLVLVMGGCAASPCDRICAQFDACVYGTGGNPECVELCRLGETRGMARSEEISACVSCVESTCERAEIDACIGADLDGPCAYLER